MMKHFFDAHHGHLLLIAEAMQSELQFSFDEDIKNSWGKVLLVREGYPTVRLDNDTHKGTIEASIVPPADKWGKLHIPSSYSDHKFTKANFSPTRPAKILAAVIKRLIMQNDETYRVAWQMARDSEKYHADIEATAKAAVASMAKYKIDSTVHEVKSDPQTAPNIWFSAPGNTSREVRVSRATVRVQLDIAPEKLGKVLKMLSK